MLGYQKLKVYQKSDRFQLEIYPIIQNVIRDYPTKDQLRRASLSIDLNMAEGATRMTRKDQRRFYIMSRSSTVECHAIVQDLGRHKIISQEKAKLLSDMLEEISRMLYGMIKGLE